ncbi:hypothetical protein AAFF_G00178390 [Aldrovandia affinis]|uniref:Uncharacterized protein n=1 Tax=Aldrovandia affinis TaxID=143900 RepID=A0AAD7RKI6_9TELE|nr:hypothetical protein AAFF_G00178390 [Aldrovandia affinis]
MGAYVCLRREHGTFAVSCMLYACKAAAQYIVHLLLTVCLEGRPRGLGARQRRVTVATAAHALLLSGEVTAPRAEPRAPLIQGLSGDIWGTGFPAPLPVRLTRLTTQRGGPQVLRVLGKRTRGDLPHKINYE